MRITVRTDFERVAARIATETKSRLPVAAAKALTFTAERVREAEYGEMRRIFDRPTPFTLRALRLRSATPAKLEAAVWVKDEAGKGTPAINFIGPHIFGGARKWKRMERALQSAGLMPQGAFAVPGAGAKLDRFGNVSGPQVVQIMGQLRLQRGGGFESRLSADRKKAARTIARQGGRYFVAAPGGGKLPRGIWQKRSDGSILPIFIFVQRARYKARFDFFGIAERTARAHFPALFDRAIKRELERASARR